MTRTVEEPSALPTEEVGRRRGRRRMWILGGLAVAVVAGIALALTQPWTILLDRRADQAAPASVLATSPAGSFVSLDHPTTGSARLLVTESGDTVLRIEGLDTDNGPDLKVWLSEAAAGSAGDAGGLRHVALGDLTANQGNLNYAVPAGADLTGLRSVVIWCERFGVAFGAAPITPPSVEAAPAAVTTQASTAAMVTAAAQPVGAPTLRPVAGRSAVVRTAKIPGFGRVLVNGRGLPLYLFTADTPRQSRCSGACAAAWPVVRTSGQARAAGAAEPALLGTIRRADGSRQVTYNGHPLYTYVDDRPGVALCHDVIEFGGLWLLVRADGSRVP